MKATQFILPLLIVTLILSCEKLEIETAKDTSFILSEETKDGVLYVDGVAQVELIKDINLTDATLNEGLLKVESLTKLFSTMKGLAKYNSKSLESFYVQNDFNSVYNQLMQIRKISREDDHNPTEFINDYIHRSGERYILTDISEPLAMVLNKDGMLQIGDYVGLFKASEVIWTLEENISKLFKYKKDAFEDEDLIVIPTSVRPNRDQTDDVDCSDNFNTGEFEYENASGNRRMFVKYTFTQFNVPVGGNSYEIGWNFTQRIDPEKKLFWSWWSYRTDIFHSYDYKVTLSSPNYIYHTLTYSNQDAGISTNSMGYTLISTTSDVYAHVIPGNHFWSGFKYNIHDINPGSSGNEGTCASTSGMQGFYGRLECE